ncbi:MAG: hypothetical protein LBB90_06285 [Tannerella sp.]|jgi:hypothetical protein|nr:hypothetical protein [Tannerella sp.]
MYEDVVPRHAPVISSFIHSFVFTAKKAENPKYPRAGQRPMSSSEEQLHKKPEESASLPGFQHFEPISKFASKFVLTGNKRHYVSFSMMYHNGI